MSRGRTKRLEEDDLNFSPLRSRLHGTILVQYLLHHWQATTISPLYLIISRGSVGQRPLPQRSLKELLQHWRRYVKEEWKLLSAASLGFLIYLPVLFDGNSISDDNRPRNRVPEWARQADYFGIEQCLTKAYHPQVTIKLTYSFKLMSYLQMRSPPPGQWIGWVL